MELVPCPKCYDPESGENRGSYMYDENHGTPCELCCAHDQGWSLLLEHYGDKNGLWCCLAGCGWTISPDEHLILTGGDPEARDRRLRPSGLASSSSHDRGIVLGSSRR